jgi:trimethylamine:corrinoid methyltransferase-like protein
MQRRIPGGRSVLTQMIRPGKEVIYSTLPTVADMRSGAYSPGAIETGMLHMACAQMARYYNVPSGGYIGLTNSKINDAQSGYETGMSVVAGYLGGVDIFNMGGLLDSLMAFDFAKAVIDNEIAMMMKRIRQGFEFSEANFALDQIRGRSGRHVCRHRAHPGAHALGDVPGGDLRPRPARPVEGTRRARFAGQCDETRQRDPHPG